MAFLMLNMSYKLRNLVEKTTSFKSQNGTLIDLMLTNRRSFLKSHNFEIGLSDCHKPAVSILVLAFFRKHPRKIWTADFYKMSFTEICELPTNCLSVFDHFVELALKELRTLRISNNILNIHAPLKKEGVGGIVPFITQDLTIVIKRFFRGISRRNQNDC